MLAGIRAWPWEPVYNQKRVWAIIPTTVIRGCKRLQSHSFHNIYTCSFTAAWKGANSSSSFLSAITIAFALPRSCSRTFLVNFTPSWAFCQFWTKDSRTATVEVWEKCLASSRCTPSVRRNLAFRTIVNTLRMSRAHLPGLADEMPRRRCGARKGTEGPAPRFFSAVATLWQELFFKERL